MIKGLSLEGFNIDGTFRNNPPRGWFIYGNSNMKEVFKMKTIAVIILVVLVILVSSFATFAQDGQKSRGRGHRNQPTAQATPAPTSASTTTTASAPSTIMVESIKPPEDARPVGLKNLAVHVASYQPARTGAELLVNRLTAFITTSTRRPKGFVYTTELNGSDDLLFVVITTDQDQGETDSQNIISAANVFLPANKRVNANVSLGRNYVRVTYRFDIFVRQRNGLSDYDFFYKGSVPWHPQPPSCSPITVQTVGYYAYGQVNNATIRTRHSGSNGKIWDDCFGKILDRIVSFSP
jgi:hypothetical protein